MKIPKNKVFAGHYGNPKVKFEDSLEGKSSEVTHTLFGSNSLPELCSHISYCPVKSCKVPCQINKFYNKYGTQYI
jgi:hypothetical protein